MNELLREIEDDIRAERVQKLWNGFGKAMVAVSVAVVLATIVAVIWQNHRQSVAMDHTSQFLKGMDRMNIEDYKGAVAVFDSLSIDESSPYYGISMLRKAQAQELLADKEGARKTYEALAKHEGEDRDAAFAGLAKILAAHASDAPIEPLKGAPFYYAETEWKAWELVKAGKKDDAAAIFEHLYRDLDAPASMRQRAGEALQHVAPEKLAAISADLAKGGTHE